MVTHALGRKPLDLIIATLFRNCKKSLKMLKGKSESVSRKDNAMAKRKRINKDIQTLHIKLKIEYTNTTKNRG